MNTLNSEPVGQILKRLHRDAEVADGPLIQVDLALIDGAWSQYLPVLKLIEPSLRLGAVILGENAFAVDYLSYIRDPANGSIAQTLAIDEGRGNEFAVRVL